VASLTDILLRAGLIGLDTSPFIFLLEEHPKFLPSCDRLFGLLDRKEATAVTSVVTLLEVLVRPLQVGDAALTRDYRDLLLATPGLTCVSIDESLAERAASLRASFGIRPPDAIQIAAAIQHGARCFVTADAKLARVSAIEIVLLQDYPFG
jgi:predicted nucleic acid-binding protein